MMERRCALNLLEGCLPPRQGWKPTAAAAQNYLKMTEV